MYIYTQKAKSGFDVAISAKTQPIYQMLNMFGSPCARLRSQPQGTPGLRTLGGAASEYITKSRTRSTRRLTLLQKSTGILQGTSCISRGICVFDAHVLEAEPVNDLDLEVLTFGLTQASGPVGTSSPMGTSWKEVACIERILTSLLVFGLRGKRVH
mmetsp:Transcript_21634/g.64774  ORF Transcript_21634/g.64774 Transcript_21634/m.64774 type:complete len:156 (-) Transcript_21634:2734-3201(-)